MSNSENNKRIAKNTALLYFRMIFTMSVTLYTSRVILNTLGVVDFGIYNVVGGVVTMFTVLNSAMAASTSRFLIFELGKQDFLELKKVFNASLSSHIAIAIFVLVLSETIGLWFLTHKLQIPQGRMSAVFWVYQFSVLGAMLTLTQVPYNAMIIAHEKMNVYAYVSIIEVVLKLVVVFLLVLGGFDKLKLFAVLVFLVSLIITIIFRLYCSKKYKECSLSFQWDKVLYKKLFSFSVWELYGSFAVMGMSQGLNILLNIFFGPVVNAARAIAFQVQSAITSFGENFMVAVKPQIIKLYAEDKLPDMMKLVFNSSKYSFFLTYFLTLPLLLETEFVLKHWLKIYPDYTITFCQLTLINNLLWSMRSTISTCFHAVGKIKIPNLVIGSLNYLIVIVSYFSLKLGLPPQSVFVVSIGMSILIQITELNLLKRMITFSIKGYVNEVIRLCVFVLIVSAIVPYFITYSIHPGFLRFLVVGFTSVITISLSVFYIGVDKSTQNLVFQKLNLMIQNRRRKD